MILKICICVFGQLESKTNMITTEELLMTLDKLDELPNQDDFEKWYERNECDFDNLEIIENKSEKAKTLHKQFKTFYYSFKKMDLERIPLLKLFSIYKTSISRAINDSNYNLSFLYINDENEINEIKKQAFKIVQNYRDKTYNYQINPINIVDFLTHLKNSLI